MGRLDAKKLLLLCSNSSDKGVYIIRGASFVSGLDYEAPPVNMDSSAQKGFIEAGIPAIQALSGSHTDFHKPGDTFKKLDFRGMRRTAEFLKEIIGYLAGEAAL